MNTKKINDTLKSHRTARQLTEVKQETKAAAVKMLDAKARLSATDAKLASIADDVLNLEKQLAQLRRMAQSARK